MIYRYTILGSEPACSDWSHPCWFTSHTTHLGILNSTLTRGMVASQGRTALLTLLVQLVGAPPEVMLQERSGNPASWSRQARLKRAGGISYPGQTAWHPHRSQLDICSFFSVDNIPGPLVPKGEGLVVVVHTGLCWWALPEFRRVKTDLRVITSRVGEQVRVKSP